MKLAKLSPEIIKEHNLIRQKSKITCSDYVRFSYLVGDLRSLTKRSFTTATKKYYRFAGKWLEKDL